MATVSLDESYYNTYSGGFSNPHYTLTLKVISCQLLYNYQMHKSNSVTSVWKRGEAHVPQAHKWESFVTEIL